MVWLEWRRGSDQYTLTRLSWDIWRPLWICIFWATFGHFCSTADRIDLKFQHSVAVDQALEMARSPVLYGQSKARARGVCVPYYSAARPILFKRYVKKGWIDDFEGTVGTRICCHFQKCKNHPDQSRFDQVMKDFCSAVCKEMWHCWEGGGALLPQNRSDLAIGLSLINEFILYGNPVYCGYRLYSCKFYWAN